MTSLAARELSSWLSPPSPPTYGPIGTFGKTHAIVCEKHADRSKHEDVVNKRCGVDGCKAHCNYGPIGTFGFAHAIVCPKHADKSIHEAASTGARRTAPTARSAPSAVRTRSCARSTPTGASTRTS